MVEASASLSCPVLNDAASRCRGRWGPLTADHCQGNLLIRWNAGRPCNARSIAQRQDVMSFSGQLINTMWVNKGNNAERTCSIVAVKLRHKAFPQGLSSFLLHLSLCLYVFPNGAWTMSAPQEMLCFKYTNRFSHMVVYESIVIMTLPTKNN